MLRRLRKPGVILAVAAAGLLSLAGTAGASVAHPAHPAAARVHAAPAIVRPDNRPGFGCCSLASPASMAQASIGMGSSGKYIADDSFGFGDDFDAIQVGSTNNYMLEDTNYAGSECMYLDEYVGAFDLKACSSTREADIFTSADPSHQFSEMYNDYGGTSTCVFYTGLRSDLTWGPCNGSNGNDRWYWAVG